ncbi:MAG: hypothetical protein ABIJ09_19310 [Pseudomonadota bacterium]
MEKLNVSNKQATTNTNQADEAAKAPAKTDFAQLLQQKAGENAQQTAGQQATSQARGQLQQHAGRAAMNQSAQGAAMSQANQQAAANAMPRTMKPMVQNPHLAKVQQATKQFDQQLAQAKQSTVEGQKVMGDIRSEAKAQDLTRSADRSTDTTRAEVRSEVNRGVGKEMAVDSKVRAEAQQQAMRNLQGNRTALRDSAIHGVGSVGESGRNQAAAEVKGARKPQEIPQEILDKLVEEVRVGVNENGQSEFQIDLKDGVLQGMSLKVTAENGKVNCQFIGGDNSAKNFIESSQGALARALEGKGLSLDRLSVATA